MLLLYHFQTYGLDQWFPNFSIYLTWRSHTTYFFELGSPEGINIWYVKYTFTENKYQQWYRLIKWVEGYSIRELTTTNNVLHEFFYQFYWRSTRLHDQSKLSSFSVFPWNSMCALCLFSTWLRVLEKIKQAEFALTQRIIPKESDAPAHPHNVAVHIVDAKPKAKIANPYILDIRK